MKAEGGSSLLHALPAYSFCPPQCFHSPVQRLAARRKAGFGGEDHAAASCNSSASASTLTASSMTALCGRGRPPGLSQCSRWKACVYLANASIIFSDVQPMKARTSSPSLRPIRSLWLPPSPAKGQTPRPPSLCPYCPSYSSATRMRTRDSVAVRIADDCSSLA